MLANLGFFALCLALASTMYATVMALVGAWQHKPVWLASAQQAALFTWPLITLACVCLVVLLVTDHYEIAYVSNVTSRAMPLYLKITALWGGQAGSLLWWSWLMATFASAAIWRNWRAHPTLMPYALAVMMLTLGFFVGLVVFYENPFGRVWVNAAGETVVAMLQPAGAFPFTPIDGRGLNPLLRHPGMIIHPPMLYTGFVSFVVPYAFAVAALITRRADDAWLRVTRRWTLTGWLFLSLGLILGGRWAYDVLGWGGYWGWDPVENAAFLPWLTATAFLHSVMIQEKRGQLKKWNMVLIILTYALVIFGTFLTRSGVLSSVHAFAQSAIGPAFFVFIGFTFLGSLFLLARAWGALYSERPLTHLLSREAAFLLNNLLFVSIAASVFWGTIFPLISELVTNQKISVGPPFYNRVAGPQFAALVLLMGLGPLLAWQKDSWLRLRQLLKIPSLIAGGTMGLLVITGVRDGVAVLSFGITALVAATTLAEFVRGLQARRLVYKEAFGTALARLIARNRRRYGGYIIHLGVTVMTLGILGSSLFQIETQGQLQQGEQLTLGRYVMVYDGLQQFLTNDDREVTRATVSVYRDEQLLGQLHPRRDFFLSSQQPMTIPGVRSTWEDDFYVLLVSWEPLGAEGATFKLYVNPLINWVWAGGLVFILGTLVAVWPSHQPVSRAKPALQTTSVVSNGD